MRLTRRMTLLSSACALATLSLGLPVMAAELSQFTDAKMDWKQFEGTTVNVLLSRHPWQEAIEPLIPQFEELTGMTVNLRTLPEQQFLTKVPADLTAGTFQFDVFMTQIAQAPQYAASKWVAEIDGFKDDPKLTDPDWYDWDDFFPGAQAAATIGNTPFANLAITAEAQVLVYRKDVLADLGLPVPATFDELLSTATTITENTDINGISVRGGPALWWPMFGVVKSFGGDYFNAEMEPTLTAPETIAGVQAYVDLAAQAPQGVTNYDWDEINTAMLSGQAAMFIDSSVVYPRLMDTSLSDMHDKVGVVGFPSGPVGAHPNSHYWTISMAENSPHKEAAWLFMEWATSKPIQAELALDGVLAPRASAWEGEALVAALGQEFLDAVKTSLSTSVLTPSHLVFTELSDALRSNVQNAMTGSKTVEQALTDAQATWEAAIAQ